MRRLALAAFLLALVAPAPAGAARFAVGLQRDASPRLVAQRIEARTGRRVSEIPPFALTVTARGRRWPPLDSRRQLGRAAPRHSRRLTFTPNDPLAARQWYLNRIDAFEAWGQLPFLPRVRVAVIDSGIDAEHPELEGQIAGGTASSAAPGRATQTGTAHSSPARSPLR